MAKFHLRIKLQHRWETVSEIEARNHREAFGKAMMILRPEMYDKPIQVEAYKSAKRTGPGF